MNPKIGLITPVKVGLGHWLTDFYAQFQPDTASNAEWAARGNAKAMAWAPGRMVDAVEEMLSAWRNNDNSGKAGTSAYIPVLFAAVANEYTETPGEDGRPLTDRLPFSFPDDTLKREFQVSVMSADLRAQLVVVAQDQPSAMSIVGQLCLWAQARRTFTAPYAFAGFTSDWPARVISADRMAVSSPVSDNLTILTVDLTIRVGMPLFYLPFGADATDGQGVAGSLVNPPGFAVLTGVAARHNPAIPRPANVSAEEWAAYIRMTGGAPGAEVDAVGVVLRGVVDSTLEPS